MDAQTRRERHGTGAAAGRGEMAPFDVPVPHSVNHRGREKKLADLLRALSGLYDQAARAAASL